MSDLKSDAGLPVIIYIDENNDALEDFYIDARNTGLFGKVIILAPKPKLKDMIETLLQSHFEALISDFRLANAYPVEYDGSQLVDAFLKIRAGFPCFIRTSYDNEALHASDDVNRVYTKEGKAEEQAKRSLFDRISLQIQRHRQQVKAWCDELDELLSIDRSTLTAPQIDRIIELDARVEAYMGVDNAVAQTAKKVLLDGRLHQKQEELLAETERLISDIKQTLNG